jgi:hypothetical protein
MKLEDKMGVSEMEKFLEKYELHRLRSDFVARVITLIIASLGLIAALAWDTALKHLFEDLFGATGTLAEELSYAVVITVIAVIISVSLGKLFGKPKK